MLTRIDTGALDGLLAVEIDCSALPAGDAGLVSAWLEQRELGASVTRLVNGSWDDPAFHAQVLELLSDERAAEQTVWVERDAGDRDWCPGELWWVLDGTELLGPDTRTTVALVQAMPPTPEIDELVLRVEHRAYLSGPSLDEIAMRVGAGQCWLYVEPADLDTAMRAAAQAGTVWGVRVK